MLVMLLLSRVMKLICEEWVSLARSSPSSLRERGGYLLSESSRPMRLRRTGKLSRECSSQKFIVRYSMRVQPSISFLILGVIVRISIPSRHSSSSSLACPLDSILFLISLSARLGIVWNLEEHRINYYISTQNYPHLGAHPPNNRPPPTPSPSLSFCIFIASLITLYSRNMTEIPKWNKYALPVERGEMQAVQPTVEGTGQTGQRDGLGKSSEGAGVAAQMKTPSKGQLMAFPEINLQTQLGQLSIKGCPYEWRQKQSRGDGCSQQYVRLCAQEYDKKYLMRNFPLSYFQNVDLLFKMIGKKKRFIKQTYTAQLAKRNQEGEIEKERKLIKSREGHAITREAELKSRSKAKDVSSRIDSVNRGDQIGSNSKKIEKITRDQHIETKPQSAQTKYRQIKTRTQHGNKYKQPHHQQKAISERKPHETGLQTNNHHQKSKAKLVQSVIERNSIDFKARYTQNGLFFHHSKKSSDQNLLSIASNLSHSLKTNAQALVGKRGFFPSNKLIDNLPKIDNIQRQSAQNMQKVHEYPKILECQHILQERKNEETHLRHSESKEKGQLKNKKSLKSALQNVRSSNRQKPTLQKKQHQECTDKLAQPFAEITPETNRLNSAIKSMNQNVSINEMKEIFTNQQKKLGIKQTEIIKDQDEAKIMLNKHQKQYETLLNQQNNVEEHGNQKLQIQQINRQSRQSHEQDQINHFPSCISPLAHEVEEKNQKTNTCLVEKKRQTQIDLIGEKEFGLNEIENSNWINENEVTIQHNIEDYSQPVGQCVETIIKIIGQKGNQIQLEENINQSQNCRVESNSIHRNSENLDKKMSHMQQQQKLKRQEKRSKRSSKQSQQKNMFIEQNQRQIINNNNSHKNNIISKSKKMSQITKKTGPIERQQRLSVPPQQSSKQESSLDHSDIDHFYDELIEMGANQNTEYKPKFALQIQNQQSKPTSQLNILVECTQPEDEVLQIPQQSHSKKNNLLQNQNIQNAHIYYTESSDFINNHEQEHMAHLRKKLSSRISIFSEESDIQRIKPSEFSKNHQPAIAESSEQTQLYLTKANNLNNSMVCIDINAPLQPTLKQENKALSGEGQDKQYAKSKQNVLQISQQANGNHSKMDQSVVTIQINAAPIVTLQIPQRIAKEASFLSLNTQQQAEINRDLEEMEEDICNNTGTNEINNEEAKQFVAVEINRPVNKNNDQKENYQKSEQYGNNFDQKNTQKLINDQNSQLEHIEHKQNHSVNEKISKKEIEEINLINIRSQTSQQTVILQQSLIKASAESLKPLFYKLQAQKERENDHISNEKVKNCMISPDLSQIQIKGGHQVNITEAEIQNQNILHADTSFINQKKEKNAKINHFLQSKEDASIQQFQGKQLDKENIKYVFENKPKLKDANLNKLLIQESQKLQIPYLQQKNEMKKEFEVNEEKKKERNIKMHKIYEINICNQFGLNKTLENSEDKEIKRNIDKNNEIINQKHSSCALFQSNQMDKLIKKENGCIDKGEQYSQKVFEISHKEQQKESIHNKQSKSSSNILEQVSIKIIEQQKIEDIQFKDKTLEKQQDNQQIQQVKVLTQNVSIKRSIQSRQAAKQAASQKYVQPQNIIQINRTIADESIPLQKKQGISRVSHSNRASTLHKSAIQSQKEDLNQCSAQPHPIESGKQNLNQSLSFKDNNKGIKRQSAIVKQVLCNCEEQYFVSEEITPQNQPQAIIQAIQTKEQITVKMNEFTHQNSPHVEEIAKNEKNSLPILQFHEQDNVLTQAVSSCRRVSNELQTSRKDVSTNTLEMLKKGDSFKSDSKSKQIIEELALINKYCLNFNTRPHQLESTSYELKEQEWEIAVRMLKIMDPQNRYITRLIDEKSIWLCSFDEEEIAMRTYTRYDLSCTGSRRLTEAEMVKQSVKRVLGMSSLNRYVQNNIKTYLQILTGMPVLLVKESCYHKLDNLYRHSNIFGFTYGRRAIWKIVGIATNDKKSQEKRIKLEEVGKKKVIEISWNTFLEEFKYSIISCFALNYHMRSLTLPVRSKKQNTITFGLKMQKGKLESKKIQCLLGFEFYSTNQIQGKVMIYCKMEGNKDEERYKYLGSGDLALISMKLKPGEYLIVVQTTGSSDKIFGGRLLMGCESESAVWLEDSWKSTFKQETK